MYDGANSQYKLITRTIVSVLGFEILNNLHTEPTEDWLSQQLYSSLDAVLLSMNLK